MSEWVGGTRGDSCCWYTWIGIFAVKSTLFKFVFEVEDLVEIKSWLNEYLEVGLNFIWTVTSVCCIICERVVKGLIGFGLVRSFNSHLPDWVISFHFSFLGTKVWVLLGLYCNHGRKYHDMSVIYRVSEGMNTIFYGEISFWRNFERNRKKSSLFFAIYWGLKPQTKGLGFSSSYHQGKFTLVKCNALKIYIQSHRIKKI